MRDISGLHDICITVKCEDAIFTGKKIISKEGEEIPEGLDDFLNDFNFDEEIESFLEDLEAFGFAGLELLRENGELKSVNHVSSLYLSCLLYTSSLEEAQLKVRNWNEPGESVITSVPMPEIVPLNRGMNIMQSEGSYITYLKRYLLTNLFLIMEKDVVDAIPQNNSVSESVVASDPVQKVREYIHSKDKTIEITPLMINQNRMKMVKSGDLTKEESKTVFEWFKKQEKEAKS